MKRKSWFTMNILVVLVLVVCVGCNNTNVENDTDMLLVEEKTTEEEVITEEEMTEEEIIESEEVSILASIYSTEVISLSDNWLTIKVQADSLASYVTLTDNWDYVTTTEVTFELADNCEWYICSPLALHGDYSDAIESDEEEIMQILISELEAKIAADENGDPFDTSMSMMIRVEDGKIVQICQVSA